MIVWLASFPRSGNTLLRILLYRLYGARSSVVYDMDGVAGRLGGDMVGYEDRPASYDAMRASPDVHFVKTHRQRDGQIGAADGAICLVRDGRDALVSWARMLSEDDPGQFEARLEEAINRQSPAGTGSWGRNVLSWLDSPMPGRVAMTYETLIANPASAVERALAAVAPGLVRTGEGTVPEFAVLRATDPQFFRRGISGSHRDEMPAHLHRLFWSKPDNVEAMARLGLD